MTIFDENGKKHFEKIVLICEKRFRKYVDSKGRLNAAPSIPNKTPISYCSNLFLSHFQLSHKPLPISRTPTRRSSNPWHRAVWALRSNRRASLTPTILQVRSFLIFRWVHPPFNTKTLAMLALIPRLGSRGSCSQHSNKNHNFSKTALFIQDASSKKSFWSSWKE